MFLLERLGERPEGTVGSARTMPQRMEIHAKGTGRKYGNEM